MSKKKYYLLFCFCGSGSKLLQAQISNSENLFTIPAYPLKYLPFFFDKWKKEKKNLHISKIFNLIKKHHASLFDSRDIEGFSDGLNKLGKNKDKYIKISKKRFKNFFLNNLKNKKIKLENIITAIHGAYQFSINDKSNNVLFHVHDIQTFQKFLPHSFHESKFICTTRHPTYNFWRRAYADDKMDKAKFDITDYENLKNYRYITRLRCLLFQFVGINYDFKKKAKLVRFEDIKNKNYQTLKKLSNFLNIKFNYSKVKDPSYNNKKWYGSNIYKGHGEKKNYVSSNLNLKKDLISFTPYEIIALETSVLPYMKKLNYKTVSKSKSHILNYFYFFILILLPTKYGIKLFFSRFNFKIFFSYIKASFTESFSNNNKNYYFNATYKFKWSYDLAYLIKFNLIRKINYKLKKNVLTGTLNFLIKIFIYPIIQIELLLLYFVRIYVLLRIFSIVKKKVKYLSKL